MHTNSGSNITQLTLFGNNSCQWSCGDFSDIMQPNEIEDSWGVQGTPRLTTGIALAAFKNIKIESTIQIVTRSFVDTKIETTAQIALRLINDDISSIARQIRPKVFH